MKHAGISLRGWIVGLLTAGLLMAGFASTPALAGDLSRPFDPQFAPGHYSGQNYGTWDAMYRAAVKVEQRQQMLDRLDQKLAAVESQSGEARVEALVSLLQEVADQQRGVTTDEKVSHRFHPERTFGRHYGTELAFEQAAAKVEARRAQVQRVDSMIARLERTHGTPRVDAIVLVAQSLIEPRLEEEAMIAGFEDEVTPAYASAGRIGGFEYGNREDIQRAELRAQIREARRSELTQKLAAQDGMTEDQKIDSVIGLIRNATVPRSG